jgi:TfoX/Sxy family transcriptional regulator of competence genes
MFGGIGWLLNGNMCCGVYKDWLIVRVGTNAAPAMLAESHVGPMDITGKPMKGWAMVASDGVDDDEDLRRFVEAATAFVSTLPEKA